MGSFISSIFRLADIEGVAFFSFQDPVRPATLPGTPS